MLADETAIDVGMAVLCQGGPPEVPLDKLDNVGMTGMASQRRVMILTEDTFSKVFHIGNKDMIVPSENAVIEGPTRKVFLRVPDCGEGLRLRFDLFEKGVDVPGSGCEGSQMLSFQHCDRG